jgi:protein SCO1
MGLRHLPLTLGDRRHFLACSGALALGALVRPARAHNEAGSVDPPQPPPSVALTFDDGSTSALRDALAGRASAIQLMFTSCQATCPIQGALFAEAARKLGGRLKPAQLLSISIDPEHDTPARLKSWLERFGPSPRWRAARPEKEQIKKLADFLKSRTQGPDPHTGQVYFFNRKGELVLRSVDFPPAVEVVRVLEAIVTKG